jgi:hypothetical protein
MKTCHSCGRKIKPSGEKILTINDKTYCSECQQKSEVQTELKAVKSKITKLLLIPLGVVVVLALVIGGVVW